MIAESAESVRSRTGELPFLAPDERRVYDPKDFAQKNQLRLGRVPCGKPLAFR